MRYLLLFLLLTLGGPFWLFISGKIDFNANYQTANRASAGLAPDPKVTEEAVIQVYAARAFHWRGLFSMHTWIAVKSAHAKHYLVYQVVGWRVFYGLPPLMAEVDIPDRYWFNQKPQVIYDLRGEKAEKLIPKIAAVVKAYPYPDYELWPGPNSNTLPAYIARAVPELALALPANAIGKDFLPLSHPFVRAPSNTGYQLSLLGLFGILIAKKEGLEINILGFVYGINPAKYALLLPGIGQLYLNNKEI